MKLKALMQRHVPCIKETHVRRRAFTMTSVQLPLKPLETDQTFVSRQHICSNSSFSLLGICNNFDSLKKIHGFLLVRGLGTNLLCQTKLVSLFGSFGYIEWARLVFDQIRDPDFYSWKVMIRWYFLNDIYSEVILLYNRMRQCLGEKDNVVFSVVLKACSELRDMDEGMKLHGQIIKMGSPDSFVSTGLVDMYAKCGEIGYSRRVFEETVDKNVVSWTSMIVGYIQNGCLEEALILFNQMRHNLVNGNQFTLGSLITACIKLGALHQGKWIHGYMIKNGIIMNAVVVTTLIDMYVKCGSLSDAYSVFSELSFVEIFSWTAMIVGYSQRGYYEEALRLFTDKKWAEILPNSVTIASVLSACAQSRNLRLGMSVHSLGIKLGLEDTAVNNALVDLYAKSDMIGDACYIFETTLDKGVIAWNSLITGYSQNGYAYEALTLFRYMRLDSVSPDAVTLVSVLSACASVGALHVGCSLHPYAYKLGLLSCSIYVSTALLNFYAKCGDARSARKVFDMMGEKNIITWSAMMGGYGMDGDGTESLALFGEMLNENLDPTEVIFTNILSACSHTGMVQEGLTYFDLMSKEYGCVPSVKHYVSMVDLLARAGRLEEALDFIERMPVKSDVTVFGALLHGCRLHARLDIGKAAARRMLKLYPDKAEYYVLVSNLYASEGRWHQANEVRELMKRRGLSKSPGCSLVEMDNINDISPLRMASL